MIFLNYIVRDITPIIERHEPFNPETMRTIINTKILDPYFDNKSKSNDVSIFKVILIECQLQNVGSTKYYITECYYAFKFEF